MSAREDREARLAELLDDVESVDLLDLAKALLREAVPPGHVVIDADLLRLMVQRLHEGGWDTRAERAALDAWTEQP